jgi:hypothetical protein
MPISPNYFFYFAFRTKFLFPTPNSYSLFYYLPYTLANEGKGSELKKKGNNSVAHALSNRLYNACAMDIY